MGEHEKLMAHYRAVDAYLIERFAGRDPVEEFDSVLRGFFGHTASDPIAYDARQVAKILIERMASMSVRSHGLWCSFDMSLVMTPERAAGIREQVRRFYGPQQSRAATPPADAGGSQGSADTAVAQESGVGRG